MQLKRAFSLLAVCLLAAGVAWSADDNADAVGRLNRATRALDGLTKSFDHGVPDSVLKGAKCIAIVPNLTKGGIIVAGAEHGKGVATCRLADRNWSAPAFFSITGGNWGPQIGIEDTHLVIFVMNDEGARKMMSDKFQIGAEASAALGPIGRTASAGTDWTASTEFLTYSRAKGLFAGIDLAGSWIEADKGTDRALYGKEYSTRDLLSGQVTPPADSRPFLNAVAGAKSEAAVDTR